MVTGGAESDYSEWLQCRMPDVEGGVYAGGPMHNDWTARPWHLDEPLHPTNWTVSRALEFLRKRDPSCPFFLCVSFLAPHPPLIPPACYFERYLRTGVDDPIIGDWAIPPPDGGRGLDIGGRRVDLQGEALLSARAGYYGLINHVDDQIRRLLSPVLGVQRMTDHNTIVLFTSDHGELLGDHYHWHKIVPYEPAARIPLLISAPQRFELGAGSVVDTAVCLEDIMPTLLDMAGVDIPDTVEGSSLLPAMRGGPAPDREYLHIQHAPLHHCLTDGREKYIWFVVDGREQFFDLTQDPKECHDLSANPASRERMAHWRSLLVEKLKQRPEGFSDGQRLIPGREFGPTLPHAGT